MLALPEWFVIVGLLIGATIGSFLNVVIYRLPRNMSLAEPKNSFCPSCKHQLGVADLFPLFSWLLSKGKCRHCGLPIAKRYFFVELLNGILWAAITWQFFIVSWDPIRGAFYALTTAALVAVIYIDWELYIIPEQLNASILIIGILYRIFDHSLLEGLYGALLGWGLLWGIALLGRVLFRKDAMGHGDIKMMRGVGFVIGPLLLASSLAIAVVAGLVIGVTLIFVESRKKKPEGEEPEDETPMLPESIPSLLTSGVWYLLCLDVIAIPFPQLYKWAGIDLQSEEIEEDNWEPSATTIPFGPYLAVGAIVCMIFYRTLDPGIREYFKNAAGPATSAVTRSILPHV